MRCRGVLSVVFKTPERHIPPWYWFRRGAITSVHLARVNDYDELDISTWKYYFSGSTDGTDIRPHTDVFSAGTCLQLQLVHRLLKSVGDDDLSKFERLGQTISQLFGDIHQIVRYQQSSLL